MTTKKEFYEMLERHDWFYMMSDDNRVYLSGEAAQTRLNALANTKPAFKKLYEEYREHLESGPAYGTERKPKPPKPR